MATLEQLQEIQIDSEFEKVCPALTEDEANRLEANILADGEVTSPLIVWNGVLLDGHNRRRIILRHPELPFTIKEMSFANRYDAVVWICKNQLGRRNITENMKAYLIGMQYKAEKQSHGASDGFRGNRYTSLVSDRSDHLLKTDPPKTRERVAKDNGVSEGYVQRAELFTQGVNDAEEAVPGVKEAILSGEIKASKKEVAAIAKAPAEERKQLVEDLMKPKDNTQKKPRAAEPEDNTHKKTKAAEPEEPDKKRTVSIANIAAIGSELGREKEGNNVENVLGIIRGAVHDFLWTCEINLNDFPELLEAERPRLQAELIELKTYIDSIFKEVINA